MTHVRSKANGYNRKHIVDNDCGWADVLLFHGTNNTDYCGEGMNEENTYYCDKCEKDFEHNEESYEVSYGYICKDCFESWR